MPGLVLASTSPSASQYYQLAGRPSEEVRAAEEVVVGRDSRSLRVAAREPLASEGASMRARSRPERAHEPTGRYVYGDEGDEDGGQEQPQQDRGMNGNAGAQKSLLAADTCYLPLFLLLFLSKTRTHKSHSGRGKVMRGRSSGKTARPDTRASPWYAGGR